MIRCIDDVPKIPKLLGAKGYESFQSGKWWEGHYSRGGFSEGVGTVEEGRFTIQAVSVLPDGSEASSINIHERVDGDHYTWESTGRELAGEVLPNLEKVTFVRKKA